MKKILSIFLFLLVIFPLGVFAWDKCPGEIALPNNLQADKDYSFSDFMGWCEMNKGDSIKFTYKGHDLFTLELRTVSSFKLFYHSVTGNFRIKDHVNGNNLDFSVNSQGAFVIGTWESHFRYLNGFGQIGGIVDDPWGSDLVIQSWKLNLDESYLEAAKKKFAPPPPEVDPKLTAAKQRIDAMIAQVDAKIASVSDPALKEQLQAQRSKLLQAKAATEAAEVEKIIADAQSVIRGIVPSDPSDPTVPSGPGTGNVTVNFYPWLQYLKDRGVANPLVSINKALTVKQADNPSVVISHEVMSGSDHLILLKNLTVGKRYVLQVAPIQVQGTTTKSQTGTSYVVEPRHIIGGS
jgi:hypothetical protein